MCKQQIPTHVNNESAQLQVATLQCLLDVEDAVLCRYKLVWPDMRCHMDSLQRLMFKADTPRTRGSI